jgi:hypothetical protein
MDRCTVGGGRDIISFCERLYCNEGGEGGASRQTVESASRKDFMTDIIHHFSAGRCYFLVGRG